MAQYLTKAMRGNVFNKTYFTVVSQMAIHAFKGTTNYNSSGIASLDLDLQSMSNQVMWAPIDMARVYAKGHVCELKSLEVLQVIHDDIYIYITNHAKQNQSGVVNRGILSDDLEEDIQHLISFHDKIKMDLGLDIAVMNKRNADFTKINGGDSYLDDTGGVFGTTGTDHEFEEAVSAGTIKITEPLTPLEELFDMNMVVGGDDEFI